MAAIPVTTGLQLLLDARTITGINNADKVASWADQSGQANHAAQATDANRPTYRTNIFGTNPAVRFGASNEHLHGLFAAWGVATGQTLLLCINNTPSTQTNFGRFLTTAANVESSYQNDQVYCGTPNGDLFIYHNGVGIKSATPLVYSSGVVSPVVIGFGVDSTTLSYVCNGVLGKSTHAAGIAAAPTKYSFGYIDAGVPSTLYTAVFDCHFAVIFNGKLTDLQINKVSNWMLTELGVIEAAAGGGLSLGRTVQ